MTSQPFLYIDFTIPRYRCVDYVGTCMTSCLPDAFIPGSHGIRLAGMSRRFSISNRGELNALTSLANAFPCSECVEPSRT